MATYSLFVVIAVALVVSWMVAVLFAPLIGVLLLPKTVKHREEGKSGRLMRMFRGVLVGAMRWRWVTTAACVGAFAFALIGMRHVQQQFFPASDRSEILRGYGVATGGTVEESAKGQGPIISVVPVMLLVMAIILIVRLQSVGKLALVVSVAPLGLIGVNATPRPSAAHPPAPACPRSR